MRPAARLVCASGAASRLHLEPCRRAIAAEAVERWHYSRRLQAITVDQLAVFEDERWIGAVIFGPGPRNLAQMFDLGSREACELIRVALDTHASAVSRIVAIAVRLLRAKRPELRVMVSYADTEQGHHGGIYQAGGWTYSGPASLTSTEYIINGRRMHGRSVGDVYGRRRRGETALRGNRLDWIRRNVDPTAYCRKASVKHRYFLAFDEPTRRRVDAMAKPYPKRAKQAMAESPSVQRQGGTDPHAPLI